MLNCVSSSGNSKNIINAIEWAKKNVKTVSFNGFDGGKANKICDISINVPYNNYGIIEDPQSIMHILAQSIRMQNIEKNLSKFIFN